MLQEMKLEDALKKFLQGKEVLVMYNESLEPEKPTYTVESIKEALKNWRFLAEVPAIENQDFKQAVKEMVELGTEAKKEHKKAAVKPELVRLTHKETPASPEMTRCAFAAEPAENAAKRQQSTRAGKLDGQEEKIIRMLCKGKSQREIAEAFNVNQTTVCNWIRKHKKCQTCKYRDKDPKKGNCDYVGKTGHSRNCSVYDCEKYEEGEPVMRKKALSLYE